jgi:alpha-amylase/alpha-mannosidase (GH57 family)
MTHHASRYICIHGHFYQPPRENPWLQSIEHQESAHPYHDWNERIAQECYTPNAHARILDRDGLLSQIINNYEYMSFNFGPTLLSWLEMHAPDTHEAIVQADSVSRDRLSGHGNAIAQPYNHMIMPLASTRDKITQITWGIKDFEKRFHRDPEGMWLPETAVDSETLKILVRNGISYTILAQSQAHRFRFSPDDDWTLVDGNRIDPSTPYQCILPGGKTITLFFYDAPISHAIAFEKLLDNGDHFRNRLMDAFSALRTWPQLVHVATDGESYGHHHRFGEMALAYAVEQIQSDPSVTLTNYAHFLDLHPPFASAEFVENSSWSCAHGVGRWSEDCGCSLTPKPGWNQKWRSVLRTAMDHLRDTIDQLFEQEVGLILKDPWEARNQYISVLLAGRSNSRQFFTSLVGHDLANTDYQTLSILFEMQLNRMLMYTSCGWFFDDISGIEATQILRYAARVLQLAYPYNPHLFLEFSKNLAPALSNVKPQLHGDQLFRQRIVPQVVDLPRVIAHVAIFSVFENVPIQPRVYCYDIHTHDFNRYESGERILLVARVSITSRLTAEVQDLVLVVVYLGTLDFRCSITRFSEDMDYPSLKIELPETFQTQSSTDLIRKLDRYFPGDYFSLKDLFPKQRSRIISTITRKMYEEQASLFESFYYKNKDLSKFITDQSEQVPDTFLASARFVLNRSFLTELDKVSHGAFPDGLSSLIHEAKLWKIPLDTGSAEKLISNRIFRLVLQLKHDPYDESLLKQIISFFDLAEDLEIPLQLGESEILFFRIAQSLGETLSNKHPQLFYDLAERLAVRVYTP